MRRVYVSAGLVGFKVPRHSFKFGIMPADGYFSGLTDESEARLAIMENQPVIAFIGAGNMAGCIINGLIKNKYPAENIIATRRSQQALAALHDQYGIETTADNEDAVRKAGVVIIGVKPKDMKAVLTSIQRSFAEHKPLLISIAAGTTLEQLDSYSGRQALPVIRSMPNTPSSVMTGVTSLYANKRATEVDKALAETIFSSVGITEWLSKEEDIHAYTALAGSGPAYLFLFMEALSDAAECLGINKEVAMRLTMQTVYGAALLADTSEESPEVLRRQVTSPGGVTAAALSTFEKLELKGIVLSALESAIARSKEMAEG